MRIASSYRVFPHTGDLGLEVFADDPAELFAAAGRALIEQMARVQPAHEVEERVELEGDGWEDLFVHWLNSLLLRSEIREAWWTDIQVLELAPRRLVAEIAGPRRAPGQERMREVKAVSFHDLALVLDPGRAAAHFVLDL